MNGSPWLSSEDTLIPQEAFNEHFSNFGEDGKCRRSGNRWEPMCDSVCTCEGLDGKLHTVLGGCSRCT